MSWLRLVSLTLGPSLLVTPAFAQSTGGDDPIVVTGERIEKARQESFAYVREIGVARGDEQVARWLSPICPKVVGIAAEGEGGDGGVEVAMLGMEQMHAGVGRNRRDGDGGGSKERRCAHGFILSNVRFTFLDDTPPNPPGFVPPVFRVTAKTMVNKLLIALSNG